jgi:aminoglycoside phosphotransferase (APT) family kinase protein
MEDVVDKLKRNQKNYQQTEKGKATTKRYNQSNSGKTSRKKYLESELGQAALLRYYNSEKAETARQKRRALEKLFSLTRKYLVGHPEVPIEEALKRVTEEKEEHEATDIKRS